MPSVRWEKAVSRPPQCECRRKHGQLCDHHCIKNLQCVLGPSFARVERRRSVDSLKIFVSALRRSSLSRCKALKASRDIIIELIAGGGPGRGREQRNGGKRESARVSDFDETPNPPTHSKQPNPKHEISHVRASALRVGLLQWTA